MRTHIGGVTVGLILLLSTGPVRSDAMDLMAVGVRGGVSVRGTSPLGERLRQDFVGADAIGIFRLPYEWYAPSGWGVGTRLITGIGALTGEGTTGFVGSVTPVLAIGDRDGRYTLDTGIGGALLSEHRFGRQNMGGPFQFSATLGINAVLLQPIGVGYRFQHYSDGTIYGLESRGVDLHMIELTYRS